MKTECNHNKNPYWDHVCKYCGKTLKHHEFRPKTLLDSWLYWGVMGGLIGATIVQLLIKAGVL